MLNAKAISKSFQSCMCPGIDNIYLVNKAGALVLAANNHEAIKTLGAIVSNIWSDYDACMSNSEGGEGLRSMIIQGEHGVISVDSIANMYLCVQGASDIGRILEVNKRLKDVLEAPLREVITQTR